MRTPKSGTFSSANVQLRIRLTHAKIMRSGILASPTRHQRELTVIDAHLLEDIDSGKQAQK
jgi:hypothetical protein